MLLSNLVLVDVNVISKSIKVATEHKWSVHERAWIDKLTFFFDFHLLEIEYETSIKDLESQSTLATENENFVIGDLIGQAHVAWNPLRLVDQRRLDLLPHILGDVIALNGVDDVLLVDSASKCKEEVILKSTKGNA